MNTAEAIAVLGTVTLSLVLCLSALPAYPKMLARSAKTEEERRSWEGSRLIWLSFLLILAILVWRVS